MTHYAKPCDASKIGYGRSLLKDIWCLPQIDCPLGGGDARYWKTLDIGFEIMGQHNMHRF
jgi:hypothetical protein